MGVIDMDIVYPLHFHDQNKLFHMPVNWLLHFNDVLDPRKLHDTLWRLLEIGDWKKLGGRLRRKDKNLLEVHVPVQYSAQRPPFAYFHQDLDICLDEHPLAAFLGETTPRPTTQPLSQELREFMMVPGSTPSKFEGYVNKDLPMLSLRITSFSDATLVGLSWPHTLMDASGAQALFQAWSLLLSGKESELPQVIGAREDALLEAVQDTMREREELTLENWRLKGTKKVECILRYIYRIISEPHVQARRIFIPQSTFQLLKAQAIAEMNQEKAAFISENDVFLAWMIRILQSSKRKPGPVTLLATLNARFRVQQLKQAKGVFLQNMIVPNFTFLPRQVATGNMGDIALSQRAQMKERSTEPQALAYIDFFHDVYVNKRNPFMALLFGEKDATPIGFNNMTKIGILETVDFAPAVLYRSKKEQARSNNPPGTLTRYTDDVKTDGIACFVGICVAGKDYAGDYWLIAKLRSKQWARIEQELMLL